VVENEARILERAGHEVVRDDTENARSRLSAVLDLGASAWNPAAAQRLRRLVRDVRPDVTHVHNTWFHLSGSVLSAIRGAGSPVVLTLHNYRFACAAGTLMRDGRPCDDCPRAGAGWPAILHRCYRHSAVSSAALAASNALHAGRGTLERDVDVLVATSDASRALLAACGVPTAKLVTKHHFVEDPGTRPSAPSASTEVLFVGRLSPEKGPELLCEAWSKARPKGLTLRLLGDGPLASRLGRYGRDDLELVGSTSREETARRMLAARAIVVPSVWREPFGMVAIEALAAAAALVVSDVGALPELAGGGAAELVAPGDVPAWADALGRLVDHDAVDLRGAAARERWAQRFSPSMGLAALESTYALAMERYARAPSPE